MAKEDFKLFARKHPELIEAINNQDTNWQKLYEIYDIYGEDLNVWEPYLKNKKKDSITKDTTIADLLSSIKKLDLETVQNGINNIQKAIALLQDIGITDKREIPQYESRPMYQYFED